MTETLGLMLRVGLSFSFVLILMWFAARLLRGKLGGRGAGALEVLARQQVGRGASIAVVRVADRALVVGVTEHGVSMLGEPLCDLAAFEEQPAVQIPAQPAGAAVASGRRAVESAASASGGRNGALSGSILCPATWRQVLDLVRERTVRR